MNRVLRSFGRALTVLAAFTIAPAVAAHAQTTAAAIQMTITVDGLEGNDQAVLRIGVDSGNLQLTGEPLYEQTVRGPGQNVEMTTSLQDGSYLLTVDAPDTYFREPRAYLFLVHSGSVVNTSGRPMKFTLIPPWARDYEPYRGPTTAPSSGTVVPPPSSGGVTYRMEAVADLSAVPPPIQLAVPPPTMERSPSTQWPIFAGVAFVVLAAVAAVVLVLRRRRSHGAG